MSNTLRRPLYELRPESLAAELHQAEAEAADDLEALANRLFACGCDESALHVANARLMVLRDLVRREHLGETARGLGATP